MDSKALTKIQSAVLIAIVVVATVGGGVSYVLWRASLPPPEDIRIGVCADLDNAIGKHILQAAILAAEQVNADGGVLGRNFTIVAEDDNDEMSPTDVAVAMNAFTKLITLDDADFIFSNAIGVSLVFPFQDISSEHKKIMFSLRGPADEFTQRVLDDYEKYKYFFRLWPTNSTTASEGVLVNLLTLREYTGFNKVAFLFHDSTVLRNAAATLNSSLSANGFDIVYIDFVSLPTTDFTSYFAAVEASGAEILVPGIVNQASISLVKEWSNRESPFVIWGYSLNLASDSSFWELTEGKCEYVSFAGVPVLSGYPLTNKTVPTGETYLDRWGTVIPSGMVVAAYDGIRFILPDAIRRAGTIETEAVIKALESTAVETSLARRFVFTGSHDVMIGLAGPNVVTEDYVLVGIFQWQDGKQVLVCPEELMEESGGTYKLPSWQGPWRK